MCIHLTQHVHCAALTETVLPTLRDRSIQHRETSRIKTHPPPDPVQQHLLAPSPRRTHTSHPTMSQTPSTPVKVPSTAANYTPATLDADLRSNINAMLIRDGHVQKYVSFPGSSPLFLFFSTSIVSTKQTVLTPQPQNFRLPPPLPPRPPLQLAHHHPHPRPLPPAQRRSYILPGAPRARSRRRPRGHRGPNHIDHDGKRKHHDTHDQQFQTPRRR